jgi:hypothetical protein
MTKPIAREPIYGRRRFEGEVIEQCVRWYISYRLSYRDLAAMMAALGDPLRAGVQEAMESLGTTRAVLLASR